MNKQALTRGALAGMAGGVVMAMWSMIVLWLTGSGFWTSLNLIAHTLWRSAPLDGSFSVGALVIGLVVHMMMSMVLGMMLAAIVGTVRALGADQVRRAGTGPCHLRPGHGRRALRPAPSCCVGWLTVSWRTVQSPG
jgi:hypothetical protein